MALATDAVGADVIRLLMTGRSAGSDDAAPWTGWELVHPTRGCLPLDRPLGDLGADLTEGGVLYVRARDDGATGAPVDDVAEHARTLSGEARPGLVALGCIVVAALVAPAAAVSALMIGHTATATAVTGLLLALVLPAVMRDRLDAPGPAGAASVVAAGVCASTLAAGAGWSSSAQIAAGAAGVCAAAVATWLCLAGRWWRPLAVATAALLAVAGAQAVSVLLGVQAPRGPVVGAVGVLLLLAAAPPLSLFTSGLGRLDDQVAAGERVTAAEATAAVERASDDLAALVIVAGVGCVPIAGALAVLGAVGAALAVTLGVVVATRARAMVRAVHVLPLAVGGGSAIVTAVLTLTSMDHPRLVPVVVAAAVVLLGCGATVASNGVTPVTTGRLRGLVDLLGRLGVLAVPLLIAGIFDLYRLVWAKF